MPILPQISIWKRGEEFLIYGRFLFARIIAFTSLRLKFELKQLFLERNKMISNSGPTVINGRARLELGVR